MKTSADVCLQMFRSVQMLRSVLRSVLKEFHICRDQCRCSDQCVWLCVWVWVFVESVDVCICVHLSVSVCVLCVSADALIWFTNLENNNMESGFLTALGFKWFLRASVQNLRNL